MGYTILLVPYGAFEIANEYCDAPDPVHCSTGIVVFIESPGGVVPPGDCGWGTGGIGVGAVVTLRFADADPP